VIDPSRGSKWRLNVKCATIAEDGAKHRVCHAKINANPLVILQGTLNSGHIGVKQPRKPQPVMANPDNTPNGRDIYRIRWVEAHIPYHFEKTKWAHALDYSLEAAVV